MDGACVDYGYVTTPQIHYMVLKTSFHPKTPAALKEYYEDFAHSFVHFLNRVGKGIESVGPIYIDGSDGIGGMRIKDLNKHIGLGLTIANAAENEPIHLNDLCGAEFVQKERKFPRNFSNVPVHAKCASFDGDADRIVYLYGT